VASGLARTEAAADELRVAMRERVLRLRSRAPAILQSAVAAAVAWELAHAVLGHPRPFFAPVSAIIALGITVGQRARRAVELVVGVAVGLVIADLLVHATGRGPLALLVVVALAMSAAVLVGGGPVLAGQAAVSAVLVVTIQPPKHGIDPTRLLDALTGGAVALALVAVFPLNPRRLVERAAQPVISGLGETLAGIAEAIAAGDLRGAEAALVRGRETDAAVRALEEAVAIGRETTRLAPARRRDRPELEHWVEVARMLDLALRDVRVLARAALRLTRDGKPGPPELAAAVQDLARAVWALGAQPERPEQAEEARRLAISAAARATAVLDAHRDLATSAVVAQVRATAVDLLRASGLEDEAARAAIGPPPRD
jgi:uncharacterized membrane protein YgaE (UPF0421/DUF939 family)